MGSLEKAREEARKIAKACRFAYIYVLQDGVTYYASSFGPAFINAKFVERVQDEG